MSGLDIKLAHVYEYIAFLICLEDMMAIMGILTARFTIRPRFTPIPSLAAILHSL